jgi:hypothetical protein
MRSAAGVSGENRAEERRQLSYRNFRLPHRDDQSLSHRPTIPARQAE